MIKALTDTPWLITESGLRLVVSVATRGDYFADVREQALAARGGKPLANARRVEVRNGVAVVPVVGPIVRHADMLSEVSGATSTESLARDITAALEDPAVKSIVLAADSPGGEARAISDLAALIRAGSAVKPIEGFTDGLGASAAYWLLAATNRITISQTAFVGSIGAVIATVDETQAMAEAGLREIKFVSSVSPLKQADPATDAGAAVYQRRVDALGAQFVADVARLRGVSVDKVLKDYGRGDVLMGEAAVNAGLADRIGNLEGLISELSSNHQGATMQIRETLGLTVEASEQEITDRLEALVAFERDAVGLCGAKSAPEAIGRIKAGAEALEALATVRAEAAALKASDRQRTFRAALAAGLSKGTLSLGRLGNVSHVVGGKAGEAMRAALEALPEQSEEAALSAVAGVALDEDALARVTGYLAVQPQIFPEPVKAPPTPAATSLSAEEEKYRQMYELARDNYDKRINAAK